MVFGIVPLLALLALVALRSPSPPPRGQPVGANAVLEPEEPCTIEAPATFRPMAENWCDGGFFTKINISTDANNIVVLQQFSKKGQRTWEDHRRDHLKRLRSLTDAMSTSNKMNVAFTLHGTDGQMLGGVTWNRAAPESTCDAL